RRRCGNASDELRLPVRRRPIAGRRHSRARDVRRRVHHASRARRPEYRPAAPPTLRYPLPPPPRAPRSRSSRGDRHLSARALPERTGWAHAPSGLRQDGIRGYSMKVVILAGGLGTRLAEETDAKPKPMVEIGGAPILWHIMKTYSAAGFREFV